MQEPALLKVMYQPRRVVRGIDVYVSIYKLNPKNQTRGGSRVFGFLDEIYI